MSLFVELKRRNVFKVGIAYLLMGWVLLQAADFALDLVDAPNWVIQVFSIAVAIGLPIALFFAWAFEMTPEGIKREHEVDRSQSITTNTGRKLNYAISILLGLTVVYLLIDKFVLAPESQPPAATAQVETEPEAEELDEKSIAVLPFSNMSEEAGSDFFSDGITEDILNALAQVPDLKVAGRTSSFAFKGRNEDLRMIGEALGVNHILEGSVRRVGDKVRVTAQLIQVSDGFHLWSNNYDRELTDIFAIQDEISGAILDALKAELVGGEAVQAAQISLDVYDQYLKARQKMRERNEASLLEAAALLDQVIEADPDYAPARAQRGVTELLLSDRLGSYGSIPSVKAQESARRFLDEALRLDPDLAEGLAGMGLYHRQRNEDAQAVEVLERALTINPSLSDAWNWLQQAYGAQGRFREAHEITEQLHQRDPLYLPAIGNLSFSYLVMDQTDKIWEMVERIRPFYQEGPAKGVLMTAEGIALVADDREADAIRLVESTRDHATSPLFEVLGFFGYYALTEYEKSLEFTNAPPLILGLSRLGRFEEARVKGYEFVSQGIGVDELIWVLSQAARHEEIIELVTSRWPDLDAFEAAVPQRSGFGSDTLGFIALAYRATGDQADFEDTMAHFRASLDHQLEQGANNTGIKWSQAHYAMLAGDQESALYFMELAVDQGFLENPRLTDYWHVFKPLQGDERFEAIRAQIIERINEQRTLLELEPIGTEA